MDQILTPYDIAASEQTDITSRLPFLRGSQGLPAEASTYVDEPISTYEETNSIPYTAVKFGYGQNMKIDPVVEMKVRAIDEHIRTKIQEEGLRDSMVGYNTIFNRMAGNLGDNLESAKNNGSITKMLESLFIQVSISNRMPSKMYLQQFQKKYSGDRVSRLTGQLKEALAQLKTN